MRTLRKKVREEYNYQYGIGNYDVQVKQDYHNILVGKVVFSADNYSIDQIKRIVDEYRNA